MQTKQFTLYVDDPNRSMPCVQFRGIEYKNLRKASKAIVGQYGRFLSLEILGRAFVLRGHDALKFLEQEIPFTVRVSNGKECSSLPGKFQGSTDHIRWVEPTEENS